MSRVNWVLVLVAFVSGCAQPVSTTVPPTYVRTCAVTVGVAGTEADYLFRPAPDKNPQLLPLSGIVPAYAQLLSYQVECIETPRDGDSQEQFLVEFGDLTGLKWIPRQSNASQAGALACGPEQDTIPIRRAEQKPGDLVFIGHPQSVNWNTMTAGRWQIMLTYIDYAALRK